MSPIDKVAMKRFGDYSEARDRMLAETSSPRSPWIVVRADEKHAAHLNVTRDLLSRVSCPDADKHFAVPDRNIVFPSDEADARARLLAA